MPISNNRCLCRFFVVFAAFVLLAGDFTPFQGRIAAQVFDERFDDWPTQLKIEGTLILLPEPESVDLLANVYEQEDSDDKVLLVCESEDAERLALQYSQLFSDIERRSTWSGLDPSDLDLVIWHTNEELLSDQRQLEAFQPDLRGVLSAGKTLVIVGPGALASGHSFLADSTDAKTVQSQSINAGWNLLLDSVIISEFHPKDRPRLRSALAIRPTCVGIGIPPGNGLILSGRKLFTLGEGSVELTVAANERVPYRVESISTRDGRRQSPREFMADLTEWRRDAIDRVLEPFPKAEPSPPVVESGTLFIVGGGGMPEGLMDEFVKAAGGTDKAKLVYVPCAEQDSVGPSQRTVEMWKKMGVKDATFIHTKDRLKANEDPEFYKPLVDATGIWFGGGRQWNFSDSYYGTETHRLMKEVLKRGGVIGGSSAGASIQARYLARATPIQNFRIMAPGYERGGLGFISGVAIDQHFSQRGRQPNMTELVNRYPQLLGIGIDEATAIIVRGSLASVTGRGKVFFYNRRLPVNPGQPDYIALEAGKVYNLADRAVVEPAERPPAPKPAE